MKVILFGAGRVAQSLRLAIDRSPWQVLDVWNRSQNEHATCVDALPDSLPDADLLIITTADQAIASVAARIQRRRHPDQVFAHCSGALPAQVLGPAPAVSMHPLQTFDAKNHTNLATTTFALEGDDVGLTCAKAFLNGLGATFVTLQAGSKTAYHAAAVFASNYGVLLLEASRRLLRHAGINDISLLAPLWQQTWSNVAQSGPESALTGPLSRGDLTTISTHLQVIDELSPELSTLYRQLAKTLANLLVDPLQLDHDALKRLLS